jgi:hypothetical protein
VVTVSVVAVVVVNTVPVVLVVVSVLIVVDDVEVTLHSLSQNPHVVSQQQLRAQVGQ